MGIWQYSTSITHLVANPRVGVDLQGVIVCCTVLKEAVVRVEHLLEFVHIIHEIRVKIVAHFREEVEPFPRHTTIIKAHLHDRGQIRNQNGLSNHHLSVKLYPELGLQGVHFVGGYRMDLQEEEKCFKTFLTKVNFCFKLYQTWR